MEVRIYKGEDGKRTVIVRRTRRDENPTRVVHNVAPEQLKAAMTQAIREVAPTIELDNLPLPSV